MFKIWPLTPQNAVSKLIRLENLVFQLIFGSKKVQQVTYFTGLATST